MDKPFEKIAVIGTGTLGTQIALLAANAGYDVTIYDVREGAFGETFDRLRSSIEAKGITPMIPWERLNAIKTEIREVGKCAGRFRNKARCFQEAWQKGAP